MQNSISKIRFPPPIETVSSSTKRSPSSSVRRRSSSNYFWKKKIFFFQKNNSSSGGRRRCLLLFLLLAEREPHSPHPTQSQPKSPKNRNESKTWDEKLSRLVWSKRINCLKQFRWSFPPWVRRVGFFVLVGWASEIN